MPIKTSQFVEKAPAKASRADIDAYNTHIEEHGLFADAVREHNQDGNGTREIYRGIIDAKQA